MMMKMQIIITTILVIFDDDDDDNDENAFELTFLDSILKIRPPTSLKKRKKKKT